MVTAIPSSHPGMGANPFDGGTTFRVWAPNADQIHITGTFNDWAIDHSPLAHEDNGYWSADIAGAKAGDEYLYIITNGDQQLRRIDPYAREVTSSTGSAVIHDPNFDWEGDDFRISAWSELVIYEMHIGTFNDLPGGLPGSFDTAIKKLPHLKDLGVSAIQIMPSAEFAGDYSWGYNPAFPFAIETAYGGSHAFKIFVKAAHALDMAVIFDVVYNHFGPSDLDLWQFDGWGQNGKGGIYFYNDWRSQTPWGDTRPDYGRGEVRQYIRDNALVWLEEYRLDGLRWDATAHIRNTRGGNDNADDIPDGWNLMQWINSEINARQGWKIDIAEDLQNNVWITKDVGGGGAGFDAQWDAGFVHPIRRAVISPDDSGRDMSAVCDAITHRYGGDAFNRVIYTESHDEVANGHARVPEEIWPGNAGSWYSKKRSTLGAVLVFTSPGIPMIFQGQEFLEDAWFHDDDPVDWSKAQKYKGILQIYRDLIRLRRNGQNTTRGLAGQHIHIYHVNHTAKVIAFHRWEQGGPKDSVVIVANLSNQGYKSYTIGFPRQGLWKVRFNSDWTGYDREFGGIHSYDTSAGGDGRDGLPCNGNVGIGPYSAIILSQDS